MSNVENYLIINKSNNTVENIVLWDGDTSIWTPGAETITLRQAITPAKVWRLNESLTPPDYELVIDNTGVGAISFTWDGTYLTTNEPKPKYIPPVTEPQP